jgi:hypothetical protein
LSEENARDLKEVERRGLEGGINLVRGLREELRDVDFQLSEVRSMKVEYKTKISMIHSRMTSNPVHSNTKAVAKSPPVVRMSDADDVMQTSNDKGSNEIVDKRKDRKPNEKTVALPGKPRTRHGEKWESSGDRGRDTVDHKPVCTEPESQKLQPENSSILDTKTSQQDSINEDKKKTPSQMIASGDSQAIAVVPPGNRGYFTVDLWQVLLRIIGFERAAYRRGMQVANSQPNVMIV